MATVGSAPRGTLAVRAVLALMLLVGFYALALGIAGGLLYLLYLMVVVAHRVNLKIALLLVVGAGAILWGIVPRPDRFEPPGPRLLPEKHPRLFALLQEIAKACGQEMPQEVYLVGDVNAFVTQRGGLMGLGSRRVMGLGLPLLRVLPVAELRAVIAHEFGHYHGGDVALGPWIYKTRAAIGRTLETLAQAGSAILHKPFEWYGTLFMRVTMAISRRQETEADALSARVSGPGHAIAALKRVAGAAMAFGPYVRGELEPVLAAGYRPPLADGFAHFVSARELAAKIDEAVRETMTSETSDPYDSHPALPERVRAIESLGDLPTPSHPGDDRPALELLDDVAALEAELLRFMMVDTAKAGALQPLAWGEVGARVYPSLWKNRSSEHAQHLGGLTPTNVPLERGAMAAWTRRVVGDGGDAPDDALAAFGAAIVASALAAKMVDDGWIATSLPGEPIVLARDGRTFQPFALAEVLRGDMTADAWRASCAEAGVAERALA